MKKIVFTGALIIMIAFLVTGCGGSKSMWQSTIECTLEGGDKVAVELTYKEGEDNKKTNRIFYDGDKEIGDVFSAREYAEEKTGARICGNPTFHDE